jgi:formate hydrogenlyase subunit 4
MPPAVSIAVWLIAVAGGAAAIGVVEAVMARLRLSRVPQLLVAAAVLPAFAVILLIGIAR